MMLPGMSGHGFQMAEEGSGSSISYSLCILCSHKNNLLNILVQHMLSLGFKQFCLSTKPQTFNTKLNQKRAHVRETNLGGVG